jgi:hypothetical protein
MSAPQLLHLEMTCHFVGITNFQVKDYKRTAIICTLIAPFKTLSHST